MSWLDELLDVNYAPKYTDQGSEDWERIRAGRFTSSEWYKIMDCGKRPMSETELKARPKTGKGSKTTQVPDPSKMSPGGMTYIYQKVAEVLTGVPKPPAYAYPLVYGKEMEPEGVEYFEKVTGLKTEIIGFTPWGDHAGGSADRLIGTDAGLEIKCPYDSTNQINYLMLTDHYDLKREYPNFYYQCLTLMLFNDRKIWHFATYDPRMKDDKHKLTHIPIYWEKVEEDIDLCVVALEGAVKEKLQILNTLG